MNPTVRPLMLRQILLYLLLNPLLPGLIILNHGLLQLPPHLLNLPHKWILIALPHPHKPLPQLILIVLHIVHRLFHVGVVRAPMLDVDFHVGVALLGGFLGHYAGDFGLGAEEGAVVVVEGADGEHWGGFGEDGDGRLYGGGGGGLFIGELLLGLEGGGLGGGGFWGWGALRFLGFGLDTLVWGWDCGKTLEEIMD